MVTIRPDRFLRGEDHTYTTRDLIIFLSKFYLFNEHLLFTTLPRASSMFRSSSNQLQFRYESNFDTNELLLCVNSSLN